MAGAPRESIAGAINLTPHKIAVCHLIQYFVPGAQATLPVPFKSVAQHNRLGLFLFSLTRACNDFVDPPLDELITQFKAVGVGSFEDDWFVDWLIEDLTNRLSALSSPDDLYNFFEKLRGILSPMEVTNVEDDQFLLDQSSHLGVFVRCCILAFNLLKFEGVCHLLANMAAYCSSTDSTYELPEDAFNNDCALQESLEFPELNFRDSVSDKCRHDSEAGTSVGENSTFRIQAPRSHYGMTEDAAVPIDSKFEVGDYSPHKNAVLISDLYGDVDHQEGLFLRSKWQIQGYLNEQADILERHAGSFPLNAFEAILKQLQKLAPELHHVQYLRYLNSLYHEDYLAALDNLHCYFDYSAGMAGIFTGLATSCVSGIEVGRYESALLCLGILHSHFGHSKQALEVLAEAVRVSQQNNDDCCLAYTLAAMCDLLSEIGISRTRGIIGSQYLLGLGTPLSTQQQLVVLLKRSLKRADSLRLTRLMAFNRLALAKFDLKHVKRPLLSFGPKASTKLRTNPLHVCKELRLSSYLLSEFGSDGLSLPNDTGVFSTTWLKNLQKSITSPTSLNAIRLNDYDTFHFTSQPNPIPGSVLQLAGASYLLKATSWELYGSAPLVRANALIYVSCFADTASSSELSLAYVKLIQHLAVFKGYKEAFVALKLAEEKFLPISKSRIQLLKFQLLHERALHRGQLKLAQQICDKLGGLAATMTGVDMELKTEASLRHARTLLAANQFSQAAAVAHSLFCTCYKFDLHIENATILLLLAEIHKKSGDAVRGLPYALASLSFCWTFNLDLLEASANLMIAELWLSLGSSYAKRASSLVHRTLPMILGHGGLELRARANIVLVKCYLCDPGFTVSEDPYAILDPLRQAAEELQVLEYHEMAAEAFYLMAIVYNMLGQIQQREAAAASFRKHIVALENPADENDPFACAS